MQEAPHCTFLKPSAHGTHSTFTSTSHSLPYQYLQKCELLTSVAVRAQGAQTIVLRFSNGDMSGRMTNTEPTVGRRFLVRQVASVVCIRMRMNMAQSSKDIHQHIMCFEHKHKPVQDPLVGNEPSKIS